MAIDGICQVFLVEKLIKNRDLKKDGVKGHMACGNLGDKEKELPFLVNSLGKRNI